MNLMGESQIIFQYHYNKAPESCPVPGQFLFSVRSGKISGSVGSCKVSAP